ncbi:LysR family transcriptional regulator [Isoalcanivorax beigongshangi]|uniref:LysR family transcriptional regulator n=1 Tax=Isoalcanivorax beigongshangi TaxID=3238810 RepID=A0ABV4AJI9_9GAMM
MPELRLHGLDLNDLRYFAEVVRHRGFAAAGRALGVPTSTLSRRVAKLEQQLDARLLQRSTRSFHVTDVGELFYRHCHAMLVEAEAARDAVDSLRAAPRGQVRLSCPITLLNAHVGAMLAAFLQRHPQVSIQLDATNRRVDVLSEGLDLAIRVRPPPLEDSDLVLKVLADRGQCLVASPELLAERGMPSHPQALADWPGLARAHPGQTEFEWQLLHQDGRRCQVRFEPRLVTTDQIALRRAAEAGLGVVQLPRLLVSEQFAERRLVPVLEQWEPRRELIHVVFPSRRGQLPAVRELIDFLAAEFAAIDED